MFRDPFMSGYAEGPEMIVLLSGSFIMGSQSSESVRLPDEGPVRTVHINHEFAVGRYPITVDEYGAFIVQTGIRATIGCFGSYSRGNDRNHDCYEPGFIQSGNHPVTCASWYAAQACVN